MRRRYLALNLPIQSGGMLLGILNWWGKVSWRVGLGRSCYSSDGTAQIGNVSIRIIHEHFCSDRWIRVPGSQRERAVSPQTDVDNTGQGGSLDGSWGDSAGSVSWLRCQLNGN